MCKAGTNADYPDFHVQVQALSFSTPHMKLHLYVAKSEVLQSSSSSSSSLVLDKILIPEDEHENEDEYEKLVWWVEIREPFVGFRSSTQPTINCPVLLIRY